MKVFFTIFLLPRQLNDTSWAATCRKQVLRRACPEGQAAYSPHLAHRYLSQTGHCRANALRPSRLPHSEQTRPKSPDVKASNVQPLMRTISARPRSAGSLGTATRITCALPNVLRLKWTGAPACREEPLPGLHPLSYTRYPSTFSSVNSRQPRLRVP